LKTNLKDNKYNEKIGYNEKATHNTAIQYVKNNFYYKFISEMHNLKTNFHKFDNITKQGFKDRLNETDNFFSWKCYFLAIH
jgi:uncharacterized HAD superfamily protein